MNRHLIALYAVALVVSACGAGGSSPDPTVPPDPDTVVLTVTSEGGFVPLDFNLERMPRYLLTADGTLYYQGPVPEIFPGPLLPNVQVTTVDRAIYEEVMQLVEELGLPDIVEEVDNSGAEMIADASTEFITYYDDNGPHRFGFYALELETRPGNTNRVLATELVQTLNEASSQGESRPYQPERLQVAAGPPLGFEAGLSSVEPWPLSIGYEEMNDWALGWRCVEVSGEEVTRLMEVFGAANQATLWETGDARYSIKARPLLPGEEACTGAPRAG